MGAVRQIGGTSLRDMKAKIRALPLSLAYEVAQQAGPMLTRFAQDAFTSRRGVYGDPYPKGRDGEQLSLVRTGDTRRALRFTVAGTIIRCQLGPKYTKYLVGKYKILPVGDRSAMPVAWIRAMNELVATALATPSRVAA